MGNERKYYWYKEGKEFNTNFWHALQYFNSSELVLAFNKPWLVCDLRVKPTWSPFVDEYQLGVLIHHIGSELPFSGHSGHLLYVQHFQNRDQPRCLSAIGRTNANNFLRLEWELICKQQLIQHLYEGLKFKGLKTIFQAVNVTKFQNIEIHIVMHMKTKTNYIIQ